MKGTGPYHLSAIWAIKAAMQGCDGCFQLWVCRLAKSGSIQLQKSADTQPTTLSVEPLK